MKIDRRRKYYLVFDTETAGQLEKPLVYDIGYTIADKHGTIYHKDRYIVKEIFTNQQLMSDAYYSSKVPDYWRKIKANEYQLRSWADIIREFNRVAILYKVDTIAAYNLAFDMRAMASTHKTLGYIGKVLSPSLKGIKTLCLWGLACQTIFCNKGYGIVATREGWVSPVGNYRTNAEVAHRYITGNYDFIEEHTALEDAIIETGIMAHCFRQRKKVRKGIIGSPWRIPNRR